MTLTKDTLKILHVSDNGLPDWRIEKAALSAKNKNPDNQVFFAGLPLKPNYRYNFNFDWIYSLEWDFKNRITLYSITLL